MPAIHPPSNVYTVILLSCMDMRSENWKKLKEPAEDLMLFTTTPHELQETAAASLLPQDSPSEPRAAAAAEEDLHPILDSLSEQKPGRLLDSPADRFFPKQRHPTPPQSPLSFVQQPVSGSEGQLGVIERHPFETMVVASEQTSKELTVGRRSRTLKGTMKGLPESKAISEKGANPARFHPAGSEEFARPDQNHSSNVEAAQLTATWSSSSHLPNPEKRAQYRREKKAHQSQKAAVHYPERQLEGFLEYNTEQNTRFAAAAWITGGTSGLVQATPPRRQHHTESIDLKEPARYPDTAVHFAAGVSAASIATAAAVAVEETPSEAAAGKTLQIHKLISWLLDYEKAARADELLQAIALFPHDAAARQAWENRLFAPAKFDQLMTSSPTALWLLPAYLRILAPDVAKENRKQPINHKQQATASSLSSVPASFSHPESNQNDETLCASPMGYSARTRFELMINLLLGRSQESSSTPFPSELGRKALASNDSKELEEAPLSKLSSAALVSVVQAYVEADDLGVGKEALWTIYRIFSARLSMTRDQAADERRAHNMKSYPSEASSVAPKSPDGLQSSAHQAVSAKQLSRLVQAFLHFDIAVPVTLLR